MNAEILINSTPAEVRLAVIENGLPQELHFESNPGAAEDQARPRYVGNIYKGRVQRVLPGMQAAFVDIGLDRTAFLHASDMTDEGRRVIRAEPLESGQTESPPLIEDQLHEGASVVVQVLKDPIGQKGARLTTRLSIPSRYVVLLPDREAIGVSARIDKDEERTRLHDLISSVVKDDIDEAGTGYIVRTLADGVDAKLIEADIDYLKKRWQSIAQQIATSQPGECIYQDLSLPLRAVRDLLRPDIERIRVDDAGTVEAMQAFAAEYVGDALALRIELYTGERPIFDLYSVDDEIQRAFGRSVPLKSGGSIVIDETEALTVIDVNTGGYVGQRNPEETLYKTNLEAAQTIGRHLRLRNIGGIIVVDFIDMNDPLHQQQVLATLEKTLARDSSKTSLSGFSELGLVELTRKRITESLAQRMGQTCPCCDGRGLIKNSNTISSEIFRELARASGQFESDELRVLAHPDIVDRMVDEQGTALADLETSLGRSIRFQREPGYGLAQFDVVLV